MFTQWRRKWATLSIPREETRNWGQFHQLWLHKKPQCRSFLAPEHTGVQGEQCTLTPGRQSVLQSFYKSCPLCGLHGKTASRGPVPWWLCESFWWIIKPREFWEPLLLHPVGLQWSRDPKVWLVSGGIAVLLRALSITGGVCANS